MGKISSYPDKAAPVDNDQLVIVDNSSTPATKNTTRGQFLTGSPISAATISGSTVQYSTISGTKISSIIDLLGKEILHFTPVTNAVNDLDIQNSATGNKPTITAKGSDSNIGIKLAGKGTGALDLSSLLANAVLTQANAGTAGGTMIYVNLGGIKLLWCRSGTLNFLASGAPTFGFTFPTSFFSTIQVSLISLEGNTGSNNVEHFFANTTTTTSAVIELKENGGVPGTTVANVFFVGT